MIRQPWNIAATGLLSGGRIRRKICKREAGAGSGGKEKTLFRILLVYESDKSRLRRYEFFSVKVSSDGKSVRPSYLIQELKNYIQS